MLELIATPQELRKIADDPLRGKLLFAAKEAVYKAVYPLDRVFLEFHDIEVDLAGRKAVTRAGRAVALRYYFVVCPRAGGCVVALDGVHPDKPGSFGSAPHSGSCFRADHVDDALADIEERRFLGRGRCRAAR